MNRFSKIRDKFKQLQNSRVYKEYERVDNIAEGVNSVKKVVFFTVIITALACIPTTFLLTKYLIMPSTSAIATFIKGVHNIEQERINEEFYKRTVKDLNDRIKILQAEKRTLEQEQEAEIRIVTKIETETVEVEKEVERIVEVPIEVLVESKVIPPDSPVRQNLESCQEGLDALTILASNLRSSGQAKTNLINTQIEIIDNLKLEKDLVVQQFQAAEVRIKQLKSKRIRWGPGVTAGVSPTFSNKSLGVSPTIAVGITFMWG